MDFKEEVESLLAYWRRILGLQDWRIEWSIVKKISENNREKVLAATFMEEAGCIAEIQFIEELESSLKPFGLETVVVHELLHIKTQGTEVVFKNVLVSANLKKSVPLIYSLWSKADENQVQELAMAFVMLRHLNEC